MHYTSKKLFSKIYSDYGLKYYPKKFKKKINITKKFLPFEKETLKKNQKNFTIDLVSRKLKINLNNIWQKKNFKDREDLSSLHRWSWVIKMLSKNKNAPSLREKKLIEDCLINWCIKYTDTKIEKKNIIFEPYNISERICNYLILIKLQILKPNNYILKNLEKQFIFLFANIEYYKFKLSNHALNNLRAIYLFSVFTKNKEIQKYSFNFLKYLLSKFLDKNYFFKFGSSNYQFIFTKWILDILLFSSTFEKKIIKKKLIKILEMLNFFIEIDKNKKKNIPLFGNISPDFDNNWIISFFSEKKKNYFFKKYWKNFKFHIKKKNIKSKEWIKLKNEKFSIFLRNPKLVGFDFNHSHNDFFNFVLFYKGTKVILDPGRENYSAQSLKRDISGKSHNTIFINNKAIYDDYLIYNVLYKLGLKNIENCKYLVNTNYKDFIQLKSLEKDFTIVREIFLKKKYIEITDKIFTKKKSNIKIQFNFNMNKKDIKNNKHIKLIHDSKIKNLKKFTKKIFYNSYGSSYEGTAFLIEFPNNNKIQSSLKIKG